jgi:predicted XRE-type DNA-binding protein
MKRRIDHEPSSGNVFADIGLQNPDVALAKAKIARQVNRTIGEQGLTQSEAAAILGIDQPRVSALAKGRLSLFSLEKLMGFSSKLGSQTRQPSRNQNRPASPAEGGPPPSCGSHHDW